MTLEMHFSFYCNYKWQWVEARNIITNCGIYVPLFTEITHAILKVFSKYGFMQVIFTIIIIIIIIIIINFFYIDNHINIFYKIFILQ